MCAMWLLSRGRGGERTAEIDVPYNTIDDADDQEYSVKINTPLYVERVALRINLIPTFVKLAT